LQNYGTAGAQSLQFVINGSTFSFPGSLSQITIGVTPVVGGTNSNCLFVSGGVVGQQACALSSITSLTGDVTSTGPGVSVATLATVNSNVGTFGSGAVVPIITVNGKGLVTAVTTSPVSITVGSSAIVSGSNQGIIYDNGGVFGNLTTLGNAVLVTSVGGVPSMATTLPPALTIPTPTFTGTLTFPDSATWTSAGISKTAALSAGSATIPAAGNINVSGQYQVSGSQIAASNLSNGTTGSGNIVLAASPTLSGTIAGNLTLSGTNTYSGNSTFSAQDINTGTSAPASAAGNTVVMGTIVSPTLTNTGQAFLYNTVVNGAIVEGDGSTNDVSLFNKSGALVVGIPTGTTKLNFPSLSSGTCASGLGLDSGNNTVLISCPGASSSIQVGTTSITSGSSGNIEFNNAGTLGEVTPQNGVAVVSTALAATETVNAQSGTSYAILNGDRAKLITATNAAAQAYTIAQAGAGGNFASGWFVDIQNNSTNPLGIITITATTSTINLNGVSATTFKIFPGQSTRLVSDGTNYQAFNHALTNQTLQSTALNPVSSTTPAGVMMGVGSTCTLTPTYSTRMRIEFNGNISNSASSSSNTIQVRFGTGSAPANGAALTGTVVGSTYNNQTQTTGVFTPFATSAILTGLTPGTAVWFDISVGPSAGTGTASSVTCNAMEF
jgi:hypothetical protein